MTIQELGSLGEFISSVAVFASLVYLAIQVRQNTHLLDENAKSLRRSEINEAMQNWTEFRSRIITDESLAELVVKARRHFSSLTPAESQRFGAHANEFCWIYYHVWSRVHEGIFEPELWERGVKQQLVDFVSTEGGQANWQQSRRAFVDEFVDEVNDAVKQQSSPVVEEAS